jgi:uncharacterized protein
MRRVVCDVGVVISGLISSRGHPSIILDAWRDGIVDIVVSPLWLAEFDRVVIRPKITKRIAPGDAAEFRNAILREAILADDPPALPGVTPDPGDDYLVALARACGAEILVSGDQHLTELSDPRPPVFTPRRCVEEFLPQPPW